MAFSFNYIVTDINLRWKDPISQMDPYQKAGVGGTICFLYLYGAVLILPILSFEKYGRDPQKRGLKSQVRDGFFYVGIVNRTHQIAA